MRLAPGGGLEAAGPTGQGQPPPAARTGGGGKLKERWSAGGRDGSDLPTYDTLSAARGGVDAGAGLTVHCAFLLCLLCLFISTVSDVQLFRFNGPSWEGEVEETTISRLFSSWEGHC